MKNETFMKICGTASYVVPATNMSEERELYTTNSLISNWRIMGYQYDGADGIKTGSTEESGYCLVSTAKRSGRRLVAVVLGCKVNRHITTLPRARWRPLTSCTASRWPCPSRRTR